MRTYQSYLIFFNDDGMLVGTAAELGWVANFLDKIYPQTWLKIKWIQTEYYAPKSEVVDRCRQVFSAGVIFILR